MSGTSESSESSGALQLRELSRLLAAWTSGDDSDAALRLRLLCQCLQHPAAFAASFQCRRGLPDFAAITATISSLVSFHASKGAESRRAAAMAKVAGVIMQAISAALCTSKTCEDVEIEAADSPGHTEGCTTQSTSGEDSDCVWILSLCAASLPIMTDALPQDETGMCVLPHQHNMELQNAEDLCMPMRLWNGRRAYDTQKICDRCMEAILDKEFYHCSEDCDVDFCQKCHTELQTVLDKHFTARSSRIPMAHLVERMLWTMHVADELASQILRRTQTERMQLARVLAEEWPLDMFSRLVTAVVDVCNAKVLYNASAGAIASSVRRADGRESYEQQSRPLYEDGAFWKTIGLLQFLYASNALRKELTLDCQGEYRLAVNTLSFVPEAINQCRPEVELEHWLRRRTTHALPSILRSGTFTTTSPGFRCLAAHPNLLPINFRRSCVVLDVRQGIGNLIGHSWSQLMPRHLSVGRDPEILVADLEAFLFEAQEDSYGSDMDVLVPTVPESGPNPEMLSGNGGTDPDTEIEEPCEAMQTAATPVQSVRIPFHVSFRGEDGQGPGVRKEFFHVETLAPLTFCTTCRNRIAT